MEIKISKKRVVRFKNIKIKKEEKGYKVGFVAERGYRVKYIYFDQIILYFDQKGIYLNSDEWDKIKERVEELNG